VSGEESIWTPLPDVVATMAFLGDPDAPSEALRKLCEGQWASRGRWRYDACIDDVYLAGRGSGRIGSERWIVLRNALARGLTAEKEGKRLPFLGDEIEFPEIQVKRERAVWGWNSALFETALLITAKNEERFVAIDIEICIQPLGPSVPQLPLVQSRNLGGRPPTWDWEALLLAMAGRCYVEGWAPASQAEVIKAMQEWTSEQGLPEPSPSVARPKAKAFFDAFTTWQIAANENLR
jgi:hypothetical protein